MRALRSLEWPEWLILGMITLLLVILVGGMTAVLRERLACRAVGGVWVRTERLSDIYVKAGNAYVPVQNWRYACLEGASLP